MNSYIPVGGYTSMHTNFNLLAKVIFKKPGIPVCIYGWHNNFTVVAGSYNLCYSNLFSVYKYIYITTR